MGKSLVFLGIDVIFDGEISVLKNCISKKYILNDNMLCDDDKIARPKRDV